MKEVNYDEISDQQREILLNVNDALTLEQIARKLNAAAVASGFNEGMGSKKDDLNFKIRALALIHSEVSEALEALRVGDEENFSEEIIDIMIRCFDMIGAVGIPVGLIMENKHAYNVIERPRKQGHKHGKRF